MRVDWATMTTIFLAIVLAEVFCRAVFRGGSIGGTPASIGATTHSEQPPVIVIYRNPIEQYIAEHFPNAS